MCYGLWVFNVTNNSIVCCYGDLFYLQRKPEFPTKTASEPQNISTCNYEGNQTHSYNNDIH